jgi:RimJ/RimL family protein N-acetyltransferase
MIIRQIHEDDAEGFLAMSRQLDDETTFMMFEPGERTITAEQQRERFWGILAADNQMIFVAEHEGQIVGFLGAYGGTFRRNHDNALIVIGILQAFTGQGVGRCSRRRSVAQRTRPPPG